MDNDFKLHLDMESWEVDEAGGWKGRRSARWEVGEVSARTVVVDSSGMLKSQDIG